MKSTLITSLVLVAIFIVACGGGRLEQGKTANFKQGITELELSVLPNLPPEEIREGSPFTIAVKAQNRGGYDISRGKIEIIGLSGAWVPLQHREIITPTIRGRSLDAPEGDIIIEEFRGRNIMLPQGAAEYNAPFWIVGTYDYTTTVQQDVCINHELLVGVEKEDQSCNVQDRISLSGQGAPVAFTKIEEVIIPTENVNIVEFTFTVENRGRGELASPIIIDDAKLANRRLNCNPRSLTPLDIKQRRNTVTCKMTERSSGPYTTTLTANAYYTYKVTEEREFTVKK